MEVLLIIVNEGGQHINSISNASQFIDRSKVKDRDRKGTVKRYVFIEREDSEGC